MNEKAINDNWEIKLKELALRYWGPKGLRFIQEKSLENRWGDYLYLNRLHDEEIK
jgi:hypothetical protein